MNTNTLISLLLSFIAGIGTLLGSLLVFIPKFRKDAYTVSFLAFSSFVMLIISIIDLIPLSIQNIIYNYKLKGFIYSIIIFILGIITIKIIDNKVEEGSCYKKIGIRSLIGIMLHNFPEGIATFMSSIINIKLGIIITVSILIHNIPEGINIALPIYKVTHSTKKGVGASLLSGLLEPLGAIFAYLFLKKFINKIFISYILIYVSGLMITISINNLYNLLNNLKYKNYFIKGFIISIIYLLISIFLF